MMWYSLRCRVQARRMSEEPNSNMFDFDMLDAAEAKRLKALEDENGKLKRLLADAMLDNVVLKDLLGMEAASPPSVRGQGRP